MHLHTITRTRSLLAVLLLLGATSGLAQQAPASEAPATPEPTGFLAEYMALEEMFSGKMVELARAIPAEKYDWRPAEGVRSIGEVFLHIAGTNLATAQSMGVTLPPRIPQDLSQVRGKDRIVELLETSIQMIRGVARGMAGADLSQPVPNGGGVTMQGAILRFAEHHGEHLGQLIAYARSVGVVPPWSR